MEKKINVAELLKDCPKGMELDCTIYEGAELDCVTDDKNYPIKIIIKDDINGDIKISLTKEGYYNMYHNPKCAIFPKGKTTWEGFVSPCKFKDGDIVFSGVSLISIFKGIKKRCLHSYVSVGEGVGFNIDKDVWTLDNIRLATEEEKEKLFDAIKAEGYKWDSETKTLEKLVEPKFKVGDRIKSKGLNLGCEDHYELVPNKFDISTLKPFDKVLVRDSDIDMWCASIFSHTWNNKYFCIGGWHNQCIPYEVNKEILGTINDCDDFYKTWK